MHQRRIALGLGAFLILAGLPAAGAQADTGSVLTTSAIAGADVVAAVVGSPVAPDTQNQRFVRRAYGHLLERAPDAGALSGWAAALDRGTPRVQVANAITSSTEYRTTLIRDLYTSYLDRPARASDVTAWLASMRRGMTTATVNSAFLASGEYYSRAGSTSGGFVRHLYTDVLGRSASVSEVANWTRQLNAGVRRDRVATSILRSTEHVTAVVRGHYQHLLGRRIEPGGATIWIRFLQTGGSEESVIGAIVASREYYGAASVVDRLVLAPQTDTIPSDASRGYSAQGFDAYNHSLGDVTVATTFMVDGKAAACAKAMCSPTVAGEHTVTGTLGKVTATAKLTVTHADLDHLVLTPASGTITAGTAQVYEAEGFDVHDNTLGDLTSGTTFTVVGSPEQCSGATCTPTKAGDRTVTGTNGTATGSAAVHVNAAPLDHLVVTSASATMTAGDSQDYAAEGFDTFENSLGDVTATTAFDVDSNFEACENATCSATLAGEHVVTGTNGAATGTKALTITVAALHHLVLAPATATITVGGSQEYTADGFDPYNNALGDVTGDTTFTVDAGVGIAEVGTSPTACPTATCSPTAVGDRTVTGTNGAATGTAGLHVDAAVVALHGANGWGYNAWGQLGNGTNANQLEPAQATTVGDFSSVSAGYYHTAGIKADGTLWTWGAGFTGQLGDGTTEQNQSSPVQVGVDADWAMVASGALHTLAIKKDGTLWATGYNWYGELGDGDLNSGRSTFERVGTDSDWRTVGAGAYDSAAIKIDGTLWAWGYNGDGQLGDGSVTNRPSPVRIGTDSDWASVDPSENHTLARKTGGTIWAWGDNESGALGDGTTASRETPAMVGERTDWKSVATGRQSSFAITTQGTLWAWGSDDSGKLGLGGSGSEDLPVQVGLDSDWSSVSGGVNHSAALKTNGTRWQAGNNSRGQLGDGTTDNQLTFLQMGTDTNWASVSAGQDFTIGLRETSR